MPDEPMDNGRYGSMGKIRTLLETLGVVEPKNAALQKRLALLSQVKPQGPVTLMVRDLGKRKMSAISAIRDLTGMRLEDAILLGEMVPLPILKQVSIDTAIEAKTLLEIRGVTVELIGLPADQPVVKSKKKEPRRKPLVKVDFASGEYAAILTNVGLLESRVVEALQRHVGLQLEQAVTLVTVLPKPVVVNVDLDSAHRVQRELQMLGAVVEIVTSDQIGLYSAETSGDLSRGDPPNKE